MSLINNEKLTKQLVRDMKVETITDFGTFQELEAIAAELLNSADTSNKLLALRLQQRLNENPNYQQFTQRAKIEAEQITEQSEKELQKKQEIKHSNAVNNLESKKKAEIETKKLEEEKKTTEAFNKLTLEQQKAFLEIENTFPAEHRQELRNFVLTDSSKEEKQKQNVDIVNKMAGEEILEIKNGKVDVKETASDEGLRKGEESNQKVVDISIVAKKQEPALQATGQGVVMGAEQAAREVKKNEDINNGVAAAIAVSQSDKISIGSVSHIETEEQIASKIKLVDFLNNFKNDLSQYAENIKNIREFGDKQKIQESVNEISEEIVRKMEESKIQFDNLSKEDIDNQIKLINEGNFTNEEKELIINALEKAKEKTKDLKNQQDTTLVVNAVVTEILPNNAISNEQLQAALEESKQREAEAEKAKEKVKQMEDELKGITDVNSQTLSIGSSKDNKEEKPNTTTVYNPSVKAQNEREGIAYEVQKEVTKTYASHNVEQAPTLSSSSSTNQ